MEIKYLARRWQLADVLVGLGEDFNSEIRDKDVIAIGLRFAKLNVARFSQRQRIIAFADYYDIDRDEAEDYIDFIYSDKEIIEILRGK